MTFVTGWSKQQLDIAYGPQPFAETAVSLATHQVMVDATRNRCSITLRDLYEVVDEAMEEGYLRPSDDAVSVARNLLPKLQCLVPHRIEVYPTADGDVALDVSNERGSVILLCGSGGGIVCLVNLNGDRRRARYLPRTPLPDGFVREVLAELAT
ncbi:MAG: hypothetical protein OXP69_21980 [Spirochaetaceae bacterium]|nr:hypothetical protein [Spirochaetaceae bacterium]